MFRCVQLRRVWAALVFVSTALSMGSVAFAQDAVTLSGIITTRIDGQPVAGAVVTVVGALPALRATADATGRYTISVPRPADGRRVQIRVEAPGLQPAVVDAPTDAGAA